MRITLTHACVRWHSIGDEPDRDAVAVLAEKRREAAEFEARCRAIDAEWIERLALEPRQITDVQVIQLASSLFRVEAAQGWYHCPKCVWVLDGAYYAEFIIDGVHHSVELPTE